MTFKDIDLEKAEVLSVLLEGLLYGVSLPMFTWTIWALWSQRATHQVNIRIFIVACSLLLLSTVHFVIHTVVVMEVLVALRDVHTVADRREYYPSVPRWMLVSANYVYTAQTLIADGVVLYRCYVVWQSKLIMILPALLWCSVVVTGIGSPYTESQLTVLEVPNLLLRRWMTAFWTSTLATNLVATLLLACRIWYVSRKTTRLHGPRKSQLQPIFHIIVDAGAIYTLVLVVTLICFLSGFNFQYVMQDIITPIISITFYMVIIRVGLTNPSRAKPSNLFTLESTGNSTDRRSRMQVHITTHTESKVEDSQRSASLIGGENHRQNEVKFDEVREEDAEV